MAGKDRPSIITGHTIDDKFKCVEGLLNEIYRTRNIIPAQRPAHHKTPIIIPAYGESAYRSKDKIYASFATVPMTINGAMVAVDCPKDDAVIIELEIVRAGGILDSYKKEVGNGTARIELGDLAIELSDIINVYMTYKPFDDAKATKAGVTATLFGETR